MGRAAMNPERQIPSAALGVSNLSQMRFVLFVFLAMVMMGVQACGASGLSRAQDPVDLLAGDYEFVHVVDAAAFSDSTVLHRIRDAEGDWDQFLDYWQEFGDLETLVFSSSGGGLTVAKGEFNFGEYRNFLETSGWAKRVYRDFEIWDKGNNFAAAFLEDRGIILSGAIPAVKQTLRVASSDSGPPKVGDAQPARMAMEKLESGWVTMVSQDACWNFDTWDCEAVGVTMSGRVDDVLVDVQWALMFSSEHAADLWHNDIENHLEELLNLNIQSIESDGVFVVLETSVHEDDSGSILPFIR